MNNQFHKLNTTIEIAEVKSIEDLKIDIDEEISKFKLNPKTAKEIANALKKVKIDSFGRVIFPAKCMRTLIRARTKKDAQYEFDQLSERDKVEIKNENFIEASELAKKVMQKSILKPNDEKLEAIFEIINKIQVDPVVKNEREKYSKIRRETIGKLKQTRIDKENIELDELTNESLKQNAEFHHIRARGILGNEKYEMDYKLGLVLNKDTHKEITKRNIFEEDELFEYCFRNNLNYEWYEKFKFEIQKYKF